VIEDNTYDYVKELKFKQKTLESLWYASKDEKVWQELKKVEREITKIEGGR
jgi:hypothetical protein